MNTHPAADSHSDAVRKLGQLIHGIRIAMLTTLDEDGNLHSRPMATQEVDFDGNLWFFTDDQAQKSRQIQKDQHVNLSFAKPDEHRFVSVAGRAELIHDRARMQELWNPAYKAWFPQGLNTPHLCLIKIHVDHAEYWDTHSSAMVHLMGLAKALTTGKPFHPGKNEKLDLTG